MFHNPLFSSSDTRVNLNDISEKGVKALLDFIYCRELFTPESEPAICFELFYAADKYDIKELRKAVVPMLLQKPSSWFDDETAFLLYALSRNCEQYEDLKIKALQIIKMCVTIFFFLFLNHLIDKLCDFLYWFGIENLAALVNWIDYWSQQNRMKDSLSRLLNCLSRTLKN